MPLFCKAGIDTISILLNTLKKRKVVLMLKDCLASITDPLSLALILFLLYIFWTVRQSQRGPHFFFMVPLLVLCVCGTPLVANLLISSLQTQYTKPGTNIDSATIAGIVTLGATTIYTRDLPPTQRLSATALARVIEAIRLHHQYPLLPLYFSGTTVGAKVSHARLMLEAARSISPTIQRAWLDTQSTNTFSEARHLRAVFKQQRFLLVTSAYHMPRAIMTFKALGMHPIAAPANAIVIKNDAGLRPFWPNSKSLHLTSIALHEYIGMIWYQLRLMWSQQSHTG